MASKKTYNIYGTDYTCYFYNNGYDDEGVTVFRDKIEKVKSKTPHYLPSSSKDIGEYQLLHPTIMEKFFEYYNNITQKPENRDLREAKRQGKYTPIMSILERLDC